MISDTLSNAAVEIRNYLKHPATTGCYTGETRQRIEKLLAEMDALRIFLDTSPSMQVADFDNPPGNELTELPKTSFQIPEEPDIKPNPELKRSSRPSFFEDDK